ncbi:MAG TPA: sigma-70 family RNA polymerase sigma factor [Armatimonadota bacterium]
MSDEEVIRRVQRGDRRCFEELHRRYYQKVWRFAKRSLVDPELASDVASETFLRAFRSIDRFSVRRNATFAAWLFRIAANLMADLSRRAPRMPSVSLDEQGELCERLADGQPIPLDQILYQEKLHRVREAVERLPFSDRQILCLSYEDRLSIKEIAVVMGKPSATAVTSHLHRALTKLRHLLLNDRYFVPEDGESHVEAMQRDQRDS